MISFAQYGLLIGLSLFLILHFLILGKIIPYNIVWGGRLKSNREMYRFEIASILINLLFILIILAHSEILLTNLSSTTIKIGLWTMAGLLALSTLGNFVSNNKVERILFTPITLILAVLSLILILA